MAQRHPGVPPDPIPRYLRIRRRRRLTAKRRRRRASLCGYLALALAVLSLAAFAPRAMAAPVPGDNECNNYMGIEIGASYIQAAAKKGGGAVALEDCRDVNLLPEHLARRFNPPWITFVDGKPLFGEAAKNAFQPGSKNTVFDISRFIGREFSTLPPELLGQERPFTILGDQHEQIFLEVEVSPGQPPKQFTPETLMGMLLAEARQAASDFLGTGTEINSVAITPTVSHAITNLEANWEGFRDAAVIGGFTGGVRIRAPAYTAMIGLELDKEPPQTTPQSTFNERNVVIYHLLGDHDASASDGAAAAGGGLIKIVNAEQGIMDILSSVEDVAPRCAAKGACPRRAAALTRKAVVKTLSEAELTRDLIHELVVLEQPQPQTGGQGQQTISRRAQEVRAQLQEFFNLTSSSSENTHSHYSASAPALGAATLSCWAHDECLLEELDGGGCQFIDVTAVSIRIELADGASEEVVLRNTPIPTRKVAHFTTARDGQDVVAVRVLRGQRFLAVDNTLVGEMEVPVRPAPRGVARVRVAVEVGPSDEVKVTAEDVTISASSPGGGGQGSGGGEQRAGTVVELDVPWNGGEWWNWDRAERLVEEAERMGAQDEVLRELMGFVPGTGNGLPGRVRGKVGRERDEVGREVAVAPEQGPEEQ